LASKIPQTHTLGVAGPFEAAVDAIVLDGVSDDVTIDRAKRAFELSAQGEITLEITKERQALPNLVRQAAPVFRRLGPRVII
jgi:hypothetical protein